MKLELAGFSSLANGFFVMLVKFKKTPRQHLCSAALTAHRFNALLVKTERKISCLLHR